MENIKIDKYAFNIDLYQDKIIDKGFKDPLKAYRQLGEFLEDLGYEKRQQSSWFSNVFKDETKILEEIDKMAEILEWLPDCVKHFTATATSGVHDLMPYFQEELSKEDFISLEKVN